MGTLYMLLGGFSGIVGMAMALSIRFELAHKCGLIYTDNCVILMLFFSILTIGVLTWLKTPICKYLCGTALSRLSRVNFWLFLWSFYLLAGSSFLYGVGTGALRAGSTYTDLVTLSMHLAGASFAAGVINAAIIIARASSWGTAVVHTLVFLKTILIAGIFFISPLRNTVRDVRCNSIKFFPPIVVAFGLTYVAGKALDATAGSIYETSKANFNLWRTQTDAERAIHRANVIARRAMEEPLSPTEGIRAEQKSASFVDAVVSSPDFSTFIGIFTFSIFLAALFVSLHRLYIARQLRIKGHAYSKELTSSATNTSDAISIGLLTAAVTVPLARALQHFARIAALDPSADSDIFGYGSIIYEFVNTDTFFSGFTIGCALLVSITVWYLQRPV